MPCDSCKDFFTFHSSDNPLVSLGKKDGKIYQLRARRTDPKFVVCMPVALLAHNFISCED